MKERLTTYHCGKAVIKDKNKLPEAIEKLAELPTDKKASENFHRPAYQACELIRKSSELFSESVEE